MPGKIPRIPPKLKSLIVSKRDQGANLSPMVCMRIPNPGELIKAPITI